MPRYYFHIRDGEDFIEDEEGLVLSDALSAKEEAHESARDAAGQSVSSACCIEVTDESQIIVDRVPVYPHPPLIGLARPSR